MTLSLTSPFPSSSKSWYPSSSMTFTPRLRKNFLTLFPSTYVSFRACKTIISPAFALRLLAEILLSFLHSFSTRDSQPQLTVEALEGTLNVHARVRSLPA